MALQNKLKAFVRFDGSGRIIPSSLILQKSKPKVGNWKEINSTECCNYAPTTTTTSSTSTSTSTSTSSSTTTTTTTAPPLVYNDYEASRFTVFLCPPNTGAVINMGVPNGDISTASIIYAAFTPTYFTPNEAIYVKFDQLGITYTKQFTINSIGDAAVPTGAQVPC